MSTKAPVCSSKRSAGDRGRPARRPGPTYQAHVLDNVHDAVLATDERFVLTAWNRAAEELYGWKEEEVLGRRAGDVVRSEFTDAQRVEAVRLLRQTGRFQAEVKQYRRDGTPVYVSGQTIALRDRGGRIRGYLSTNRDVTARHRAEELVRIQSARAQLLADISRTFAEAGLDHQGVLKTIVERTAQMIGDACVLTLLPEAERGKPFVVFHHPRPESLAAMAAFMSAWSGSLDTPVFRRLFAGEAILVPVVTEEEATAMAAGEARRYAEDVGIASMLLVPLRTQGRVVGSLGLTRDRGGRAYTPEDQLLVQDVADRAALAIQNARLYRSVTEQKERLRTLSARLVETQESERRAIARELHDEVGQLLTSLRFMVMAGARSGEGVAREPVEEMTSRILGRIKDLSLNLRPPMLDDLGLVPTLLWHFDRYETQTAIRVRFHHRGSQTRLPASTETCVFRVVQEALTNVARHASATEAHVELATEDHRLHVRIEDAGCGFDLAAIPPTSGLTGMRERAQLLGGALAIESHPGSGTRLLLSLPVEGPR